MQATTTIIRQTQKWVKNMVIGLNFCPFARKEFIKKSIRYQVIELGESLDFFVKELEHLDDNTSTATTLIILPGLDNFDEFLNIEYICSNLLYQMGYEGIYQIATFHPDYCFDGNMANDPSNFTNRSPYPILHLLREDSLSAVLEHYENPAEIPERNIELADEMGYEKLASLLSNCLKI